MDIKQYIELAKNKLNESDGGSPCFVFDDVVLVQYVLDSKYGKPRENEEKVAEQVNVLNDMGIRTPKHLQIHREQVGTNNVCWVLQEKCKGISWAKYTSVATNIDEVSDLLKKVLNIPQQHFEKLAYDTAQLKHLGMEPKSKNVFYDDDLVNGGFIIIDLLGGDTEKPYNGSLKDLLFVKTYSAFPAYHDLFYSLYKFEPSVVEKIKQLSREIQLKQFKAMQNSLPTFKQYSRWILRTYEKDTLDYFKEQGVFEDLTLTHEEMQEFDDMIDDVASICAEKYLSNQVKLWQVKANEISNNLNRNAVLDAWKYHPQNKIKQMEDENKYDFEDRKKQVLYKKVYSAFVEKLPPEKREEAILNKSCIY